MSLTVKKLIAYLETIDNKLLEVEVCAKSEGYKKLELDSAARHDKKVILFTK